MCESGWLHAHVNFCMCDILFPIFCTCTGIVCRNFPQGTISDMVRDASEGISFICNNIASFGGDPNRYQAFWLILFITAWFQL